MDVLNALVASRQKSIAAINQKLAQLEALASKALAGAGKAAIERQIQVAVQRKVQLEADLAGFLSELERSRALELPFGQAKPPGKK